MEKESLIESLLYMSKSFIWLKSINSKYIYCDRRWKNVFFGLNEDDDVVGKTDVELLNYYRENINPIHDYGELCMSSDAHCNEQGTQCRYIEGGFMGNKLFILDVIKTPVYNDHNEITGNVGFAIDRSNQLTQVINEVESARKLNILEQLTVNGYEGSPFVYWIKPTNDYKLR